jgi:hypothetical protein
MRDFAFRNYPIRLLAAGISRLFPRGACLLLCLVILASRSASAYTGRVLDAASSQPIADAIVTLGEHVVRTDGNGHFEINGPGDAIGFRAYGYMRKSAPAAGFETGAHDAQLQPFRPKALYLSFYGVGSRTLREAALAQIEKRGMNAVVIDVKGDRGLISYKSSVALAEQIGAQKTITISDPTALIRRLHGEHLYVVARIVVFKDDPLATARPGLAVKRIGGAVYKDREGLEWTDPLDKEVWNYNIALAVEAARLGADEIQFDYVRFPDAKGLAFSVPNTMANRIDAITGFLAEARKQLVPYNVFLASDIFGYVMWNLDDTHIGQRLEELSRVVDYISPMLYPSCFHAGIPGYPNPVAHPYEIVFRSLQNGQQRTGIPPIRFRPWLQAFRDYAFDRRRYGETEIGAQIKAAETFGSDGWMLWNPRNVYFANNHEASVSTCGPGNTTTGSGTQ